MTDLQTEPDQISAVRLLGSIEPVTAGGAAVVVPSASQRRLLAILALYRGRTLRSEYLADLFDVSPGALRKTVSRLRSLVGESVLHTDPTGYSLDASVFTDVHAFVDAVRNAASSDDRIAALAEALALWHGEALEEFRTEAWAQGEALRLAELRNNAVEDLAASMIDAGRAHDAIPLLEAHVSDHPLRDHPRGLLMRALAASGRQTDALRAYQSYRRYLADEVGTEPSRELRELERLIVAGWSGINDAAVSPSDADLPGAADTSSADLPHPASVWVGPRDAVKSAIAMLPQHRLVTLTGPGGVGKTRTAIEIAHGVAHQFPDGTWFVELAPLSAADDVAATVAAVIGVSAQTGPTTISSIVAWFRGRSALLVLDNCEHLVESTAALVKQIIASCPTVRVLITSRTGLGVSGEKVVVISPLDPASSVELFRDRAHSADSSVLFTDAEDVTLSEICNRLDHMPLAIELAAARARSLSPADILQRLDQRFDLLRARGDVAVDHHRTLRATVDWSYQLLSDRERLLFRRATVFAGSFDLAAIEAVCSDGSLPVDDIAHLLDSLVEKSMIAAERVSSGYRYRMLETLRDYGLSLLDFDDHVRHGGRHLDYFLSVAELADRIWFSANQLEADAIFDREWDNLRAALQFACASARTDAGRRLLAATIAHAHHRVRSEHGQWSENLRAQLLPGDPNAPLVYAWCAWWAMKGGRLNDALVEADEGLALAENPDAPGVALGLCIKMFALWSVRRRDEARTIADELETRMPYLDSWDQYHARRSGFAFHSGDGFWEPAEQLARITESIGAPAMIASARYAQGVARTYASKPDPLAAIPFHEDGVALARSARSNLSECQNLQGLVDAKFAVDAPDLLDVCLHAMRRLFDLRYWLWLWSIVDIAAYLLEREGDVEAAATVVGHLNAHMTHWHEEPRKSVMARLADRPRVDEYLRTGASMESDSLVTFAINRLAAVREAAGDTARSVGADR